MSSPQCTQPKAAQLATRSLVSDTTPSTSALPTDKDKPALTRKTTDNYEQAAAAATKAGSIPATTAGSVAASVTDRPGMPARQQSWKMSDFKGQQQGQMMAAKVSGQGYSTTG
jgi:hypothetical protein